MYHVNRLFVQIVLWGEGHAYSLDKCSCIHVVQLVIVQAHAYKINLYSFQNMISSHSFGNQLSWVHRRRHSLRMTCSSTVIITTTRSLNHLAEKVFIPFLLHPFKKVHAPLWHDVPFFTLHTEGFFATFSHLLKTFFSRIVLPLFIAYLTRPDIFSMNTLVCMITAWLLFCFEFYAYS